MRDINRILCPVDLSDTSRHAISHAVLLARWYKATMTALHVCNPIVIPASDFTVVGDGPSLLLTDDQIKDAREQVAGFLRSAGAPS